MTAPSEYVLTVPLLSMSDQALSSRRSSLDLRPAGHGMVPAISIAH